MNKKVFLLLPDGVGLKNFIYTDFLSYSENIKVWTPLKYLSKEIEVIELEQNRISKVSDIYKSALIKANLIYFAKKFNDKTYLDYILSSSNTNNLSQKTKKRIIDILAFTFASKNGVDFLRNRYIKSIKKSKYFKECKELLKKEKPNFILCANQRTSIASAPMLAGDELNIPTANFIYSWDNMPKGNLSVPSKYLFVWSEYMKKEALKYYPYIKEENIFIVGTPQFIPYTQKTLFETREEFCKKYDLDINAKIVCFSGDDIRTSPYDPIYLEDTAKAVEKLNQETNKKYQILFRRCPVDISGRYNKIIKKYSNIIKEVEPLWETPKNSKNWSQIIPTPKDIKLLVNTVLHSETAINVGSTIAHDFATFGKTSCYFNYNAKENSDWDIFKVYKFIHFRSMEELSPIYWANSKDEIAKTLNNAIEDKENKKEDMQKWFQKIALHPISNPNKNIWEKIDEVLK